MSISLNRKSLHFTYSGNQQSFLLECLKTERKSLVKHHKEDGTFSWLRDKVVSQFLDKKPKVLHILIPSEGIYEVIGQPYISGLYCLYTNSKGSLSYKPISIQEKHSLKNAFNKGVNYKDALIRIGKNDLY